MRRECSTQSRRVAEAAKKVRLGDGVLATKNTKSTKKVRLGDLVELNMGQSPASGSYNENHNGLPFYQCNADFGPRTPTPRVWCSEPTKVAKRGDILISVRAPIGALNFASEECCIGRGLAALTAKGENDALFIYYALQSKVDDLNARGTGSTFKAINKCALSGTLISFYGYNTQRRIAAVLDKICELRKNAETRLEKLDVLVKSRFVEMFGDPMTNPMGWPRKVIKEFASVRIGPFGSMLHKEDYIEGGHPLVNPSHIIAGRIVPDRCLTLSDRKYEELAVYQLKLGDVVIGRRGEIGRCAVVEEDGYFCGTGSMFVRIASDSTSDYLQRVISFPTYASMLEHGAVGVTMKNLNAGMIEDSVVPLPPLALQREFAAFVAKVDKLAFVARQTVKAMDTLYRAKLQEFFG